MFNDGAMHIEDIDLAGRAFIEINRTKPWIRACEPFVIKFKRRDRGLTSLPH